MSSGEHDPSQQQQQHLLASASCTSSPASGPSTSHGSGGIQQAAAGNAAAATDTTATAQSAAATAGSVVVVTDSVVPSLMQVYESMTQSRLDGLDGVSSTNYQQQHQQHQMQQHQHFMQQQQQQQQQQQVYLYHSHVPLSAAAMAANSLDYSSNMMLQQQQQQQQQRQMQLGPIMAGNNSGFHISLPPIPDPTFLSAINGSNSMGAGQNPAPPLPTMPNEQFSRKVATATDADGVAVSHGVTAGDEAMSSNESNSSGGRKTRKRSLPAAAAAAAPAKDDEATSTTSSTTGRGSKSRRKGKDADGRWAKRFSWPEELHRDFVAAIFDVGLKHSSPTTILEHMPKHEQITNERVKSHLQKYRINRTKSKQEFMSSYEASLEKLKKKKHHQDPPGAIKVLSGAEVAGHLTYASTTTNNKNATTDEAADTSTDSAADSTTMGAAAQTASRGPTQAGASAVVVPQEDVFIFPRLSQAEKQSPIGASVGYLMGLFFSLKHQLMVQREAQQQHHHHQLQQRAAQLSSSLAGAADDPSQVAADFHSFGGLPPASVPGTAATSTMAPPTPTAAAAQTPTVIHIPSPNGPGATITTTAPAPGATIPPAAPAVPSTRTNLEENNIMKREMQNQMAVQNKMRALKQQELSKYRSAAVASSTTSMNMNTNSAPGITVPGGPTGSGDDAYREEPNYNNNNIPAPAHTTTAAPSIMHFNKGHHVRSTSDDLSSMRMAPPPPGNTAPMTSAAAHQQQQQQQLNQEQQQQQQYQGAGENASDDPGGGESASGNPLQVDDFWAHDVVDEQLFQFLMSDG